MEEEEQNLSGSSDTIEGPATPVSGNLHAVCVIRMGEEDDEEGKDDNDDGDDDDDDERKEDREGPRRLRAVVVGAVSRRPGRRVHVVPREPRRQRTSGMRGRAGQRHLLAGRIAAGGSRQTAV